MRNPKKCNGNQLVLTNFWKQNCTKQHPKTACDSSEVTIVDATPATCITVKSEVVSQISDSDTIRDHDPKDLPQEQTPEYDITNEVKFTDSVSAKVSTAPYTEAGIMVVLSNACTEPGNLKLEETPEQNSSCDDQGFQLAPPMKKK